MLARCVFLTATLIAPAPLTALPISVTVSSDVKLSSPSLTSADVETHAYSSERKSIMRRVNEGTSKEQGNLNSSMTTDDDIKLKYLSMVYSEDVSDVTLFDALETRYLFSDPLLPLHVLGKKHRLSEHYRGDCTYVSSTGFVPPDMFIRDSTAKYGSNRAAGFSSVPDNTWLEVTRTYIGYKEGGAAGCWFHVRKGSGVFVNVGKTLTMSAQRDGSNDGGLDKGLWHWCKHAQEQGYDSIHILSMGLDARSHEFVYCSGPCASTSVTTACVPDLELRTGLNADKTCTCDGSIEMLNCGNPIAPKGNLNPCDLMKEDTEEVLVSANSSNSEKVLFDFQLSISDRLSFMQMFEGIALPGTRLRWYPWRRILQQELLRRKQSAQEAQTYLYELSDAVGEPFVSLIDSSGSELHEIPIELIETKDLIFPITLSVKVFRE